MKASEYTSHSDHAGRIADSPSDKKQKAATTLLRDAIQKRDFLPIAARASKILGPISRHLMAQILPMICNAARASRPGLAVGITRVLCNDMCTAQRFHMDWEEQRCRCGCPDEPDSLSPTSALCITTSSSPPGGMRQFALEETICFTTASLRPFLEASSMELWLWVLSTPLCKPTTITVAIRTLQGTSETAGAWKG